MEARPSKAAILGALSQALDLVEGQPEGHALRTSRIAHRIAEELDLTDRDELYFAGVLKDSGCSNNSVRIQKMFGGDEMLAKRGVKTINWSSSAESIKFVLQNTERGQSLAAKLRRLASNLGTPKQVMNQVTEARCTRGAAIAQMLGFSPAVSDAVRYLDEHWDGGGAPYGHKGDQTPIFARVLSLAQTFEIFMATFGLESAYDMIEKRSGRWFEPELVAVMQTFRDDFPFWESLSQTHTSEYIESALPEIADSAIESDIDRICEAFAMIVDAKSSFTAQHSERVTTYAVDLGRKFGFSSERLQTLRRASLLHDVGKLGVSTGILEKPGKLDDEEFARVKDHPKFSYMILRGIPTFEKIAQIASAHHERLDGRGYWQGLCAEQLSLDVRILTVADVYDALIAERPYRAAMPREKALEIMRKDIGTAFDADCVAAIADDDCQLSLAA